jgi:hypothetical protein
MRSPLDEALVSVFPQPHARPVAVAGNEDDAGGFQGGADGGEVILSRCPATLFEIDDYTA